METLRFIVLQLCCFVVLFYGATAALTPRRFPLEYFESEVRRIEDDVKDSKILVLSSDLPDEIEIQLYEVAYQIASLRRTTESWMKQFDQDLDLLISAISEHLQRIEDKDCSEEGATSSQDVPYCEEDWTLFNNNCYILRYDKENNDNARMQCSEMDAYLVEIGSEEENRFVLESSPFRDVRIWLGLERTNDNDWAYIYSKSVATYLNWSEGEPSDIGNNEDCVEMFRSNGKWNDLPCEEEREYMCEKPALCK